MAEIHCRHFNGYKPCGKYEECERAKCPSFSTTDERILIVHLGALGAVLRSTSLIAAIKRKYPKSHITWATMSPAQHLIAGADRIVTAPFLELRALKFDIAYVIDKSLEAAGILAMTESRAVFGFKAHPISGAILPANPEANELWEIGLSNQKKFFANQKSEQQLVHEALALGLYRRDEYLVELGASEKVTADMRRRQWSPEGAPVIGINTGCSGTIQAKKLSVQGTRELITDILHDTRFAGSPIVLLGGPEDTERNEQIAKNLPVIASPTHKGLRDGLASVEACDVIFSGDSLGMHMGIGLKKWVVAWFGPTCQQEIELYGRGRKILTKASCSPCWKRVCSERVMCYDQVDYAEVLAALHEGIEWHISSSKPRFPETYSSPSPY
jgi:heptosyltransferase-2